MNPADVSNLSDVAMLSPLLALTAIFLLGFSSGWMARGARER